MPNYKVFQDNPDQARIKIYGNQDLAVNTDISGNLGITSTGLSITPPTAGLTITSTGLAADLAGHLRRVDDPAQHHRYRRQR